MLTARCWLHKEVTFLYLITMHCQRGAATWKRDTIFLSTNHWLSHDMKANFQSVDLGKDITSLSKESWNYGYLRVIEKSQRNPPLCHIISVSFIIWF